MDAQLSSVQMRQSFLQMLLGSENYDTFEQSRLFRYSELARLCYQDGPVHGHEDVIRDEHERIIGRKDGQEVWLGFRGSLLDPAHWVGDTGNCNAWPRPDGVFQGFGNAVEGFLPGLISYGEGCRIIHLTGHSRGAAFATVAGWLLAKRFPNAWVRVVVFGCPRAGLPIFAESCRRQSNLECAGFQHAQDIVGKVPPWGEHVYSPADPHTSFKASSSRLFELIATGSELIPGMGRVLTTMAAFGSSAMNAHSMASYQMSLKFNFILQSGTSGAVDEFLHAVSDSHEKKMLAIAVQAVKACNGKTKEQLEQVHAEMKELLSSARIQKELDKQSIRDTMVNLEGLARFLSARVGRGDLKVRKTVDDVEKEMHRAAVQIEGAESPELIECFLKTGLVLATQCLAMGEKPEELKKRFGALASLHIPLLKLAQKFRNAGDFHDSLPSLARVEAACAAHLNNREPLLFTDEIQDALLPTHLQLTEFQKSLREFGRKFKKRQEEAQSPGCVARLLSASGLGSQWVDLLKCALRNVQGVTGDSQDAEHLRTCDEEVERLRRRMNDLVLPEVVIAGPPKTGKTSTANAILGRDIGSTAACPESFIPIRMVPREGQTWGLKIRGTGIDDHVELFMSKLNLKERTALNPPERFDNVEEMRDTIKEINAVLRDFLSSQELTDVFSDEEIHDLQEQHCHDWTIDIYMPAQSSSPIILVDLPGSTERGILGMFIRTMVKGSCSRASTALLVLTTDMLTELDRNGGDLMERFFGGASTFCSYFLVISKMFEKKDFDEVCEGVQKKARKLHPMPLDVQYINSCILSAFSAWADQDLPQHYPVLNPSASTADQQRCKEEQRRFETVFRGCQNKTMTTYDTKMCKGEDLVKSLTMKLEEFPQIRSFVPHLYRSVDGHFPKLFLRPTLTRIQEELRKLNDVIIQRLEISMKDRDTIEQEMKDCSEALHNLDSRFEQCKAAMMSGVQARLEEKMGEIILEMQQKRPRARVQRFSPESPYLFWPMDLQSELDSWDKAAKEAADGLVLDTVREHIFMFTRQQPDLHTCQQAARVSLFDRVIRHLFDVFTVSCESLSAAFVSGDGRSSREEWRSLLSTHRDRIVRKVHEAVEGKVREALQQYQRSLKASIEDEPQPEDLQEKLMQTLNALKQFQELSEWVEQTERGIEDVCEAASCSTFGGPAQRKLGDRARPTCSAEATDMASSTASSSPMEPNRVEPIPVPSKPAGTEAKAVMQAEGPKPVPSKPAGTATKAVMQAEGPKPVPSKPAGTETKAVMQVMQAEGPKPVPSKPASTATKAVMQAEGPKPVPSKLADIPANGVEPLTLPISFRTAHDLSKAGGPQAAACSNMSDAAKSNQVLNVCDGDTFGRTKLHHAAATGDVPLIKELLSCDASVEVTTPTGRTPLHSAATKGNLSVVKLLLELRASLEAEDAAGQTPAALAAAGGHAQVAEFLRFGHVLSPPQRAVRKPSLRSSMPGSTQRQCGLMVS